jgi:DNA polymerase III subunit gamma/tau
VTDQQGLLPEEFQIGKHHFPGQFLHAASGFPAQLFFGFGGITDEEIYFRRAEIAGVHRADHLSEAELSFGFRRQALGIQPVDEGFFAFTAPFETQSDTQFAKGQPDEFPHGDGAAGGQYEIFGLLLLEHEVHAFHIVAGMAPVPLGIEVAEPKLVLEAQGDAGGGPGDLAGHEGLTAYRRFVVEKNAVTGVDAVGFAVVDGDPVGVQLGNSVGRARIEGGFLGLGHLLDQAVKLRGGGLVKAGFFLQAQQADGFQESQGPEGIGVGGIFGGLEADLDVGLGAEIVDLIGLDLLDDANQVGAVGEVTVMQDKVAIINMGILIEMIHPLGVEQGRTALDAVNDIALTEQEFSQIGTVLAGDAGDQCGFHEVKVGIRGVAALSEIGWRIGAGTGFSTAELPGGGSVSGRNALPLRPCIMSQYLVSARKYRPVRFDEVVGQGHVTDTLKSAIRQGKLAHAFLFCGPRGVGKTTCARILAKVINCENVGPDTEPCNTCSSCASFNTSASFNIHELDAASNNSVEHIRALVEQVRFPPQQGRYKIYIVDEVHMLSTSAFNAFLKTLEEPPPYAIFILATTEKHKIIPTILSRCQIYDFRRITAADTVAHLATICKQENLEAEEEALHIIGEKADGALRDALSIFDRMASSGSGTITYESVIRNLNVLDYQYYFRITDALIAGDHGEALLILEEIFQNGFEGDLFITGLAAHLRNLLMVRDTRTIRLLETSPVWQKRYHEQALLASASFLLTALNLANQCDIHFPMARNRRLHTEMALLKMAHIQDVLAQHSAAIPEKKSPVLN